MASTSTKFTVRDPVTIRDGILRTMRFGLIKRGVPNPDVGPTSELFLEAQALANELAVVEANSVIAVDQQMPDTAVDEFLARWLAIVGLGFRPAVGSGGNVTLTALQATTITGSATLGDPAASQLIDSAGLRFQVAVTSTYQPGDAVPVLAIDTGLATNHANGDILRWVAAPPWCSPTVSVGLVGGTDGLIGGTEAEDNETARGRLLATLGTPPRSGNWSHVLRSALESSGAVAMAFVYPAIRGPATLDVAVLGVATAPLAGRPGVLAPSASRGLSSALLTSTIAPYIIGTYPTHADIAITTCRDYPTTVAFGLSLPSSTTASPPGPGGGWLDGTPWPDKTGGVVGTVTSATTFTVTAASAPTPGVTRIAWLSYTTWQVVSARVLAVSGSGPWTITIDTPFTNIAPTALVFPQCANQAAYALAALKAFALMGPGEKSANPTALVRGFRHPLPQQSFPSSLGGPMLRALTDAGDEVGAASVLSATNGGVPPVPGSVTTSPYVMIPQGIGFYPL